MDKFMDIRNCKIVPSCDSYLFDMYSKRCILCNVHIACIDLVAKRDNNENITTIVMYRAAIAAKNMKT